MNILKFPKPQPQPEPQPEPQPQPRARAICFCQEQEEESIKAFLPHLRNQGGFFEVKYLALAYTQAMQDGDRKLADRYLSVMGKIPAGHRIAFLHGELATYAEQVSVRGILFDEE